MTDVSRGTSRVLNPVDVEQAIVQASNEVSRGVDEYSRVLTIYQDAERVFDLAWAHSYMNKKGPVEERKQASVIDTIAEREALDIARVSFKYVEKRLRAAEMRLSAYQSLNKSVMAMYASAGTGEY
jgi:hypothetical protein